jgi:hypothetical protein
MPKPQPSRSPDPLAGVVDRLLAQLPGLQQAAPEAPRNPTYRPIQPTFVSTPVSTPSVRPSGPTEGQIIGVWIRLILALSLGITMAGWPYLRVCGLPLMGYLAAVGTVMLAGGWAAKSAWRYRLALAHVLSLVVILYGLMLSMAELLPRTGYAMHHANWQCGESVQPGFLVYNVNSN